MTCAVLTGCADLARDQGTAPIASDLWYFAIWTAIILFVAVCALILLYLVFSEERTGCVGPLLFYGVPITIALYLAPDGPKPSTRRSHAEHASADAIAGAVDRAMIAAEAADIARNSPAGQLQIARDAVRDLRAHVEQRLEPLRDRYREDAAAMDAELRRAFSELDLSTHAELLRARDEHLDFVLLLERAAINRSLIAWLDDRITEGHRTLTQLEHNAWQLARQVEMNSVAAASDQAAIRELIDTAEVIISRGVGPDTRADVGAFERQLFDELATGGLSE